MQTGNWQVSNRVDHESFAAQPGETSQMMWVVVKVWRGIPVLAEVYDNPLQATQRSQWLLHECNPVDDEIAVFEAEVNTPQLEA
jgi:hypothetical protein